jgi:phage tail-like protein
MEHELAMVHRLANPATIPAEGLDWLAAWLGLTPDAALGEAAVRRLIGSAARLAPWRGTLRGLQGALDIASDGAVTAGRIVVVEHFRMQRTFATILGADYSDQFDSLTRGSGLSGNSLLGPAFFLGAEDEKRLFALFRPEVLRHDLTSPAERAEALRQMQTLTEDAAHRVTVLVHDETDPDRRALLSRVIARETPAHVVATLHLAPGSLLLGLQALLGVETWLGPQPEPQPVILGETRIGQWRLRGRPSIDQRY